MNIINSTQALQSFIEKVIGLYCAHKYLRVDVKTGKQRSSNQNNALHKYCEILAQEMNDRGLDLRKELKEGIEIAPTKYLIKELIWRPVQEAMTGHESTTKPLTSEYPKIYEVINRHTSQKWGINIQWPTKENQ